MSILLGWVDRPLPHDVTARLRALNLPGVVLPVVPVQIAVAASPNILPDNVDASVNNAPLPPPSLHLPPFVPMPLAVYSNCLDTPSSYDPSNADALQRQLIRSVTSPQRTSASFVGQPTAAPPVAATCLPILTASIQVPINTSATPALASTSASSSSSSASGSLLQPPSPTERARKRPLTDRAAHSESPARPAPIARNPSPSDADMNSPVFARPTRSSRHAPVASLIPSLSAADQALIEIEMQDSQQVYSAVAKPTQTASMVSHHGE